MIVARTINQVKRALRGAKAKGKSVGFVPTMGAIHQGHLSLVRAARGQTAFVVVSIFVNPIQFGRGEDFRCYPRIFKQDRRLLKEAGVDLLFYPKASVIYPSGFSTYVEEAFLSKTLCGSFRPGHFRGVCTVVTKLFNIVTPDIIYFGQKDYQQTQIIKRMVCDLNLPLKVKVLPIRREKDGLAISSRNAYLNSSQRKSAAILSASLKLAQRLITGGESSLRKIKGQIRRLILSQPLAKIDYVKIVDADNLRDVKILRGRILVALAVYIGKTRLIDNIILNVRGKR